MTQPASPAGPEATWRTALAEGRFLLQRSPLTGEAIFPPRFAFAHEGELEWVEASGEGTVYSVSVIAARAPAEPYNVALVDLAEGPRLMSTVVGIAPEAVEIGMPVRATIDLDNDGGRLVFHPV